jgi:serine/threonine protein kinase
MAGWSLSDWDDVGDIVERALEGPDADREALLSEACGADTDRLARARLILAAAAGAQNFLGRPAAELASDLMATPDAETHEADPHPDVIGAYRIHRLIGQGGMGQVYLAERADDEFRRQVAVKVVRAGLGADLIARFRRERQLLASLDHAHIAQLFDGGVTRDGRPYLVMEHVSGRPIDAYADDTGLTVDGRLELFLQVCDAVDGAHRRLVVHRDLKPANVLVSNEGSVKLLDFGVAKLLDSDTAGADTAVTRSGVRIMTPEYSSPEQFLGEQTTTAADIYSLGVVLYELLSGRRPYEAVEHLPSELERQVVNGDPMPPSVACRVDTSRSVSAHRARGRGTTVDGLSRRLRGDLDNVVLTAIRREPDRRYASVAALRADLERHRAGLPVSARPATVRYRTAKFIRRHRIGVAAGLLLVTATAAGATTTWVQTQAAAREGRRAAEIRDFLVGVFSFYHN